jgi:hypothetical protein
VRVRVRVLAAAGVDSSVDVEFKEKLCMHACGMHA